VKQKHQDMLNDVARTLKHENPDTKFTTSFVVGDPRHRLEELAKSKDSELVAVGKCV
jgi:hypothetical protein